MAKFKTFEEFLNLFPIKPRQRIRGGYNVLCPAHGDRNPSLSVSINNSKILLDCKAGCPTPQILSKLNLSESDLFLLDSQTPTIEAIYQYHDVDRRLLFEVVRYNPKAFRQRRPDGRGGFIWNLDGVRRVLYHLPEVRKAIECGEPVYLTEGEKDADRLWEWGLVATTNPMGAKKWQPQYTESLKGADVIFIPDTDPEGQEHASVVAQALSSNIKSLKVVKIPSKDVSEWFDKGNTVNSGRKCNSYGDKNATLFKL